MRVLAQIDDGRVRLVSRNGNDVTVSFPELDELPSTVDAGNALVDGEIVRFDHAGVPSFSELTARMHVSDARRARALASAAPATFVIFDLLELDGTDLTGEAYDVRRAQLREHVHDGAHWQVPDDFADGAALLEATRLRGLEGVVAKRRRSTYLSGARSQDWIKVAHRRTESYVVGGWKRSRSGSGIGSLALGLPVQGGLSFQGFAGSGLSDRLARELAAELVDANDSPFVEPVESKDPVHWCEPSVVVDVEALGRSSSGRLRQPSVRRIRQDMGPEDLALVPGGEH